MPVPARRSRRAASSAAIDATPTLPELFHCGRQDMRLTAAGCARLWRSARDKRPEPHEGRWHCRGCPIGADNAGEAQAPLALAGDEWGNVCVRCLQQSDRLIRRRLCISCYNRDREARIGRNGKGGPPRLAAHLRSVTLAISRPGQPAEAVTAHHITGPVEIMVGLARETQVRLAFGLPAQT